MSIVESKIKSAAANPGPKLTTRCRECTPPDRIDGIDVARSGGFKALFDAVYARPLRSERCCGGRPSDISPVGVDAIYIARKCLRVGLLPGRKRVLSSTSARCGARSNGHAKTGCLLLIFEDHRKQVLRTGLSSSVTTISTLGGAPVIADTSGCGGHGRSGSGKDAARMVAGAIDTDRATSITGTILVATPPSAAAR